MASETEGMRAEVPASWMGDFEHHGVWADHGEELGWAKEGVSSEQLRSKLEEMPWLRCEHPPDPKCESVEGFWQRREEEKVTLQRRLHEQQLMGDEDADVGAGLRAAQRRQKRKKFEDRQFRNVHPRPDELARWDSNAALQESQPLMYGPYLEEGESYARPRNEENVAKACREMGLDELPEDLAGEREYYRQLVYDYWLLFDGRLRAIKGVEIDVDLSEVKPRRVAPFRWSPHPPEFK